MAQLVKGLPCNHENLSLIFKTLWKTNKQTSKKPASGAGSLSTQHSGDSALKLTDQSAMFQARDPRKQKRHKRKKMDVT